MALALPLGILPNDKTYEMPLFSTAGGSTVSLHSRCQSTRVYLEIAFIMQAPDPSGGALL